VKLPLVPDNIDGWNIRKLNELLKIINVESETLEFKGRNFESLTKHFCAMANSYGGYIVLGIELDKSKNKFKKNGFDKGKEEESNGQKIGNYMYEVEPTPEIISRNLYDKNSKFYTVIQIKPEDTKKPYFTRNTCQCYTRMTNSSKPAGRSAILNLAMTKMVSREELHSHTEYLTKIYERLTGIRYYTRYEFIFLEVPDDYNQYKQGLFYSTAPNVDRSRYNDIKYLKHLDWALSHLTQDEYRQINQSWSEINSLVDQFNYGILMFRNPLREQIKQIMRSSYRNFVAVKDEERWSSNGYSIGNISDFLYSRSRRAIINDTTPEFEELRNYISQPGKGIFRIEGAGTLIQSQKQDNLNPDKLKNILVRIHRESRIVKHLNKQRKISNKINDKFRQFSKQLEHLIDDFKGGETIKGFCKLGF
jgi:hypothetical protein